MTAAHLIDPELLPLVEAMRLPVFTDETLGAIREALSGQLAATAPPLQGTERHAPGLDGDPPVRLLVHGLRDSAPPRPAILYIHGGGLVLGTADGLDPAAAALSAALGAVVVCVDYRLAPEAPFPAALHDCYAALRWMHAEASALGIDPLRVAVLGESAGGGLAASLALMARHRGERAIAFLMLGQPMLDDRTAAGAVDPTASRRLVWREDHNHYGWSRYLAGVTPGDDGYASAARAKTLEGLPPTFLSVGALDLFLEEDLAFAARLVAADVPTELHVYPGAMHAFELLPGTSVGARFHADRLAALRRALA